MQLKDVAVLITGGGSGLGAATARAMAAKGAKIGVLDQSKENAEKVAAEVKGVALHADVTDEDGVTTPCQNRGRRRDVVAVERSGTEIGEHHRRRGGSQCGRSP